MQEAIIQIGNAVCTEGDDEDKIISKVNPIKKGKQQYIVKINFDTVKNIVNINADEQVNNNTTKKYFFVDKVGGPSGPQWLVSRKTCNYHLMETIPNLSKMKICDEIDDKVKYIFENFYVNLGDDIDQKYRYVLDLNKFGITKCDVHDIYNESVENGDNKKDSWKKLGKIYSEYFQNYVKDKYGINCNNEVSLYTILIDNKPIAQYDEYRKIVINKKLGNEKNKKTSQLKNALKYCSMCGKECKPANLKNISIKFFTTNQIIFANELNVKNYFKNMVLCQECMEKLLAGENYVVKNLSTKLAVFDVYIIPHFIIGQPLTMEELDCSVENIKSSFNMVKNMKGIKELENNIDNLKVFEDEETYFLVNFIFYKKSSQATKVRRLIKDVNPYIFKTIGANLNKTNGLFKKLLGERFKNIIYLETIYYLTPIRLKSGDAKQFNRILSIYDALLTRRKVDKKVIIENIIDVINIQYFDIKSYNVKKDDKFGIHCTIMQGNMLLKFLEYMGCIKEVKILEDFELNVKDEMKDYIKELGYNEQQSAMFILGCLIGKVGNSQYKRSTEGKKAILNKLNFSGIDRNKVIRLSNEVFNKLRQEKILKYNEILYSESKRLIDKNINKWELNKNENLFYILSGYGYCTMKSMLNKKEQGGNENEQ